MGSIINSNKTSLKLKALLSVFFSDKERQGYFHYSHKVFTYPFTNLLYIWSMSNRIETTSSKEVIYENACWIDAA